MFGQHDSVTRERVRQIEPPPDLAAVSTLGRVDYADAFEVDIAQPRDRRAEEWLRAMLEGAPLSTRARLLMSWSTLGLKLRLPGADRSILGWEIRVSDDDFVLLGAHSRLGMPGELLLRRGDGGLLFATLVRHDNAMVRRMWAAVEAAHVTTVRALLAGL